MSNRIRGILSLAILYWIAGTIPAQAQSSDARTLLQEAAKAMGGAPALRALKNQVVESEGKQFDHTSTKRPGAPSQQVAVFRSTLTRDLTQPRICTRTFVRSRLRDFHPKSRPKEYRFRAV